MSEFYTATERIYYTSKAGTRIFICDKGDKIPMSQAISLGLVKAGAKKASPEDKAVRETQVEDKAARPKRKA